MDAIELFKEVGNNPIFDYAHMILFLNKKDLFEEKLKKARLSWYFPKYKCECQTAFRLAVTAQF